MNRRAACLTTKLYGVMYSASMPAPERAAARRVPPALPRLLRLRRGGRDREALLSRSWACSGASLGARALLSGAGVLADDASGGAAVMLRGRPGAVKEAVESAWACDADTNPVTV